MSRSAEPDGTTSPSVSAGDWSPTPAVFFPPSFSCCSATGSLRLLFLLGASGCGPIDGDDGEDSPTRTSALSTTGVTEMDPGGMADGDTTRGSSQTEGVASSTNEADSGEGTDSRTTTGADTTGGGAQDSTTGSEDCPEFPNPPDVISEACATYVAFLDECYSDGATSPACIAYSEALCEVELGYYEELGGADCRAAFEDAYACLGEMSCREIKAGGCADLIPALEEACMP